MNSDLFILHGWAIDQNNQTKWQPLLGLPKKAGITAHFLKIPGLSTPISKPWTIADYLHWLDLSLPKDKKINLLGHSFGGHLALHFSHTHPKRINNLILIASSGIRDYSLKARLKRRFFKYAAKIGKTITKSPKMRTLLYKLARERNYLDANPIMKKTLVNVVSDDIKTFIPKIKTNTLLIWGKKDTQTPIKNARTLHKLLSEGHLKVIANARHAPQFTHPNQVVTMITKFLNSKQSP